MRQLRGIRMSSSEARRSRRMLLLRLIIERGQARERATSPRMSPRKYRDAKAVVDFVEFMRANR